MRRSDRSWPRANTGDPTLPDRSGCPPGLNEPDHDDEHGPHEQDMDHSSYRVRGRQPDSPENQKSHSKCHKHDRLSLDLRFQHDLRRRCLTYLWVGRATKGHGDRGEEGVSFGISVMFVGRPAVDSQSR